MRDVGAGANGNETGQRAVVDKTEIAVTGKQGHARMPPTMAISRVQRPRDP